MNLIEMRQQFGGLNNLTDDEIVRALAAVRGMDTQSEEFQRAADEFKGYDRTIGQAVGDTALGAAQGVLSIGQGIGMAGGWIGQKLGMDTDPFNNQVTREFSAGQDALDAMKSAGGLAQAADTARNAEIAQRQAELDGQGFMGQMGAGLRSAGADLITNPGRTAEFIAGQMPLMMATGGAGNIVRQGVNASAGLMGRAGMSNAARLTRLAANRAGVAGAVGTGAALQGGDIAADTYEQLIARGVPPEQAREAAGRAGLKAAGVSAALGAIPGAAASDTLFMRGLNRQLGASSAMGAGARAGAVEAVTEGPGEEGLGQYFSNEEINLVDPSYSMATGVGSAVAHGAIAGGGLGFVGGARGYQPTQQTADAQPAAQPRTETGELDLTAGAPRVVESTSGNMTVRWIEADRPTAQRRGLDPVERPYSAWQPGAQPPAAPTPLLGYEPPTMYADETGVVQGTMPSEQEVAERRYPVLPADPVQDPTPPVAAQPPLLPYNPTLYADGTGVVQGTMPTEQEVAERKYPILPVDPVAEEAPATAEPRINRGQILAAIADVKRTYTRKGGTELANNAGGVAMRQILEAPDPIAAIREMHQGGSGARDEVLDGLHERLTGQTVFDWQAAQEPAADAETNSAGFVPEPIEQVQAQLDATREGRKGVTVLGMDQVEQLDVSDLAQATAVDPSTGASAVVVSADPGAVQQAAARTQQVGLKQAMGEAQGVVDPTLTSSPTEPANAVAVQQIDNESGQVLADELVTQDNVGRVQPIPGTTPRVVPAGQPVQDRLAASATPAVNTVNERPVPAAQAGLKVGDRHKFTNVKSGNSFVGTVHSRGRGDKGGIVVEDDKGRRHVSTAENLLVSPVPVQAAQEAPAAPAPKAKKAKPPKFGNRSTAQLIEIADNTKDEAEYDEARYQLYKRWGELYNEQAENYLLEDVKPHPKYGPGINGKALTYAESLEARRFQTRLDQENEAAAKDKRGQELGGKFQASVNEPVEGGGYAVDNGDTVGRADSTETENDPYTRLETRADTTAKQRRLGRVALESIDSGREGDTTGLPQPRGTGGVASRSTEGSVAQRLLGRRNAPGATVLGMRLAADLRNTGVSQLVGQRIESLHDVATLAQVYRDPRFETFRAIYLDSAGKVVGEAGYTSRLPGMVSLPQDLDQRIAADKARFGAAQFYMLHNHPSGRSNPSTSDIRLTEFIAQTVPGFQGHVVIDHNEYSAIDARGRTQTVDAPELAGKDNYANPAVSHPILGRKISGPIDAVNLAKELQTPDGHATLVLTNANTEVNLLVDVPMAMLLDNSPAGRLKAAAYLRRASREAGAGGFRLLALPNEQSIPLAQHLIEMGLMDDVVTSDGFAARAKGVLKGTDPTTRNPKQIRVEEQAAGYEEPATIKPFGQAVKEVLRSVVSGNGELKPWLLKAMTLRQIEQHHVKKLPALREWISAIFERSSHASRLAARADRIALEWERVPKEHRKTLDEILLRASVAEVSLDNTSPDYIKNLTADQRAEYAALRPKLQELERLSPQAAKVRKEALGILKEQWDYTRTSLVTSINHLISDPKIRAERIKQLDEEMGRNRGDYFPLSRFGDRIVIAHGAAKDGRDVVTFHETAASANAEKRRLEAQGVKKVTVTLQTKRDANARAGSGFVKEMHAIIDDSPADAAAKELMHESLQQLYVKSMPELSGAKHLIRRENIEGFSKNALRAFANAVTRGARYASHLHYAPRIQAAAQAGEMQSRSSDMRRASVVIGHKDGSAPVVAITAAGTDRYNRVEKMMKDGFTVEYFDTAPETARETLASKLPQATDAQLDQMVQRLADEVGRSSEGVQDMRAAKALYNHMIELQRTDGKEEMAKPAEVLGQVGYTWFLGASPAFWLMNMLQNPMIGMPHLGSKYGVRKSMGEWGKALAWFSNVRMGKLLKDHNTPFSVQWLKDQKLDGITQQELDMLQRLEDRQVLEFTQVMDLARIGQASDGKWNKAMRFAAAGAHHTEVMNRVTFALAAYRLAMKSSGNMTHEQAVRRAEDDVATAHFDYSYANKPQFMRGQTARLMLMFQQYRQHMLHWWASTIKDMVKGESPEDKKRAYKAAFLMGSTNALFAGALGMPFIGTIQMLANMFAPDDDDGQPFDFEHWVQEGLTEITGSTKAGEVAAKGIFAAMGMNIGQRIGQADLLPLFTEGSERFERNADDKMRAYLFDALGPLGSIAISAARSQEAFARGDTVGGLAHATPKAIRDVLTAMKLGTDGLENNRGQEIAAHEAFDGADVFMQALGVAPTSVANLKADRGRRMDVENAVKDKTRRLTGAFVEAWQRQDRQGVTEAMADIQAYNQKIAKGRLGRNPALLRSLVIDQRQLAMAIREKQQRAMWLALSGGTAETKRQMLLVMSMSGLFNPVTQESIQENAMGLPGLPGLPGLN